MLLVFQMIMRLMNLVELLCSIWGLANHLIHAVLSLFHERDCCLSAESGRDHVLTAGSKLTRRDATRLSHDYDVFAFDSSYAVVSTLC